MSTFLLTRTARDVHLLCALVQIFFRGVRVDSAGRLTGSVTATLGLGVRRALGSLVLRLPMIPDLLVGVLEGAIGHAVRPLTFPILLDGRAVGSAEPTLGFR